MDVKWRSGTKPAQAGGEEGMNLFFLSRVAAVVGDTTLTGVDGADVGGSDYPQGKYIVHLCNALMRSLNGSYKSLLKAKQEQGSSVIAPGYPEENQRLWHRWVVLLWKWVGTWSRTPHSITIPFQVCKAARPQSGPGSATPLHRPAVLSRTD